MEEPRKQARFVVAGVLVHDLARDEHLGAVVNLSTAGMLLRGGLSSTPGQTTRLQLRFPEFVLEDNHLDVEALIVWCDEVEDGDYHTGVKFMALPEQVKIFERAINLFSE